MANPDEKIIKSDEEWRKVLTPAEFNVLRGKGTEPPFTGKYWDTHEKGLYKCAACGSELFSSGTKFDSASGWPSFYAPTSDDAVQNVPDGSCNMERTEVVCRRCGSHLGHVFDDGPKPTHKRFCINSISLKLEKEKGA